mgnify:CR=1 FL=1
MSHDLSIRPAQPADIPILIAFIRKLAIYEKLLDQVTLTPELLEQTLFRAHPKAFAVLAEKDEVAVGFAIYFFNYSTFLGAHGLYIEDIYVDEVRRGEGIGLEILKYLGEVALSENCGRMEWSVLDWNEPSIGFYKKLGAMAMDEWTIFRLSRQHIKALLQEKAA